MSRRLRVEVAALAVILLLGPSRVEAQLTPQRWGVGGLSFQAPGAWAAAALDRGPTPPQEVGRNRTRGALWGGGIGLVAGGLLGGLTVGLDDEDGFGGSVTESAATGEAVLLGAVVGAGIGALLGSTIFAPAQRSEAAVSRTLGLAVRPSPTGIALAGRLWVGR